MALPLAAAEAQRSGSLSISELNKTGVAERLRQWCGLFFFVNYSKLFFIHQIPRDFLFADSSHTSL